MNKTVKIAALIYGFSILLSRVVGLLREVVIGRVLGDSAEADVYWVAFVLPDFLNYLLAGGALSLVLIPLLQSAQERGGQTEYWACFWRIATPLSAFICIATSVVWITAPSLIPLISPGFDAEQSELLVRLTRIILPAQVFHVCGGLISATLQARDRHLAPALAPLIYTTSIILGGLILGGQMGAEGFAWGVLCGSFLGPFICPLIAARPQGLIFTPHWSPWHEECKRYMWRALPVMLGFSIVVLDDMLVKKYATSLGQGIVSQLHYARSLMKVPMGVFGLAMGMAAFPSISRLVSQNKPLEALAILRGAAEVLLVLVGLAQAALMVSSTQAASLIWGSHHLSAESAQGIGIYCASLCLGLWAWSMQGLVARGFYARGQTWAPTLIGSIIAAVMYPLYGWAAGEGGPILSRSLMNLPLSFFGDGSHSPALGLAIISSVAISVYVSVLWIALCMSFGQQTGRITWQLLKTLLKIETAVLIAAELSDRLIIQVLSDQTIDVVMNMVCRTGLSTIIFLCLSFCLRIQAISILWHRVLHRWQRSSSTGE